MNLAGHESLVAAGAVGELLCVSALAAAASDTRLSPVMHLLEKQSGTVGRGKLKLYFGFLSLHSWANERLHPGHGQ